jgi:hypothetical protein
MKTFESFSLGAVIVPARDGVLPKLGYDVSKLGFKALGIVVEAKPRKSLILFPDLELTTWVPWDDMADVSFESRLGKEEFKNLAPQGIPSENDSLVWMISYLVREVDARFILGVERGLLKDIWSDETSLLEQYVPLSSQEMSAVRISLGVDEFFPDLWKAIQQKLEPSMLFFRVLPAGLHKIEVALYLKSISKVDALKAD